MLQLLLMKGERQREGLVREETEEYLKSRHPLPFRLEELDLQGLCGSVGEELREVQRQASEDYVAVGGELKELGNELTVADAVMQGLQHVLSDFRESLEETRAEMGQLQERTKRMTSALNNKKQVQELLTSFIESAVLESQLKEAIFSAPIDEKYCNHIRQLLKKINYLNSNLITPDSKAVRELQPELEKLKAKAAVRLRQFLLDQISLLKKPKTSVQTLQRTILGKYRTFAEFFRQQNTPIYAELCNAYRETMAKLYLSNYKLYLSQVEKLQAQLYHRSDVIIPIDSQNLRTVLSQAKHVSLSATNQSIFSLAGRDAVLESDIQQGIKFQARQGGERFTCQRLFRAVNTCLINEVIHEMIFTAEFFHLKSEGAKEIFGPLFRPTIQLYLDFVKRNAGHSNDIFAVLIVLALSERNRQRLEELGCSVLDSYFSQVGMMLWPRFQLLFEGHLNSIQSCSPSHFRKLDKGTQIIVHRFADFLTALYRLYSYFPASSVMFQKRLQAIRRAFFDLVTKVIGEGEQSQSEYLNILEEIHSACMGDPIVANFKQFHPYQQDLEREIEHYSDRVTSHYLKIAFPALIGLVMKFSKEGNSEEGPSFQGEIEEKIVEEVVREVSGAGLEKGLSRAWQHFSQRHKGYCLKIVGRKMTNSFTVSYSELYKYFKINYPSLASSLLPTHTIIKQLRSIFARA